MRTYELKRPDESDSAYKEAIKFESLITDACDTALKEVSCFQNSLSLSLETCTCIVKKWCKIKIRIKNCALSPEIKVHMLTFLLK